MKAAIQLDYISELNMRSDSSMFLCMSLQTLGYDVFYYHPDTLIYSNESIMAEVRQISISYDKEYICKSLGDMQLRDLSDFNVILIRQDPPFDMKYITSCYLLSRLHSKECIVLNNPTSILKNTEKLSVLDFPNYIPKTIITSSINQESSDFIEENGEIIAKPLYGCAGKGVELVKKNENWKKQMHSLLKQYGALVLQEFFPEVRIDGDKRVYMLDGEVLGVFLRKPASGEIKANLAAGGTAYKSSLTNKEAEICSELGVWLRKNELVFAGIDILNEHLIEINITSPTGLTTLMQLEEIDFHNVGQKVEKAVNRIKLNMQSKL